MNYLRPEILDPLTERFVVGDMPWRARRRFDRLIDEHRRVRDKVYQLENTLSPALWALRPVAPSQLVWQRIRRAMRYGGEPLSGDRRLAWPGIAAMLAVAVVATSIGWWQAERKPPETIVETVTETIAVEPAVAVINNADGETLWIALVYEDLARAQVDVGVQPESQPDKDYELWILDGNGVPASLGLLPQSGEVTLELQDTAIAALATGSTLAVSLEPKGGSPQPVPTGPVLYTAALLAR